MLSIQRYRVTVNPLHVHVSSQPSWRATGVIICGVWIVAALFAIPTIRSKYKCVRSILFLQTEYYYHVVIFQLLVSCALPLCVIAFSYIMTAHHLVKSSCSISEGTQNPRLNKRKSTAKVLLGLTVIFLISYLPFHILEVYYYSNINFEFSSWKFDVVFNRDFNLRNISFILNILLSINSCLNPVTLCITSFAFRRHFKRYLTCCCKTNSPPNGFELREIN